MLSTKETQLFQVQTQVQELCALIKISFFQTIFVFLEIVEAISIAEFESIFKNHYQELCAYANSFMEDVDAAEEIVQDLFVRFWEQRDTKEITTSIRAYFYTSVRNACLNQIKHLKIKEKYKQEQERELTFNTTHDQQDLEINELDQKIHQAINDLPEGRRKIFILSRFEGLKYQEIADKLNISIKTVENQMGEALKFLRIQLKDFIVTLLIFIKLFTHF